MRNGHETPIAPRIEQGDFAKFKNDLGLVEIGIGVKQFKCIGVSPPDDHPHIYLDMGDADFIRCLYCNTKYVFRPDLDRYQTEPPGNFFGDEETD